MDTTIISPDYQITIPEEIREKWNVKPGQKVLFIVYGSRLEIVPVLDIKEARGIFKGINTDNLREEVDDEH